MQQISLEFKVYYALIIFICLILFIKCIKKDLASDKKRQEKSIQTLSIYFFKLLSFVFAFSVLSIITGSELLFKNSLKINEHLFVNLDLHENKVPDSLQPRYYVNVDNYKFKYGFNKNGENLTAQDACYLAGKVQFTQTDNDLIKITPLSMELKEYQLTFDRKDKTKSFRIESDKSNFCTETFYVKRFRFINIKKPSESLFLNQANYDDYNDDYLIIQKLINIMLFDENSDHEKENSTQDKKLKIEIKN